MTNNTPRWYGLLIALVVVAGTFGYAFVTQPTVLGSISTFEIKQFNSYSELTNYVSSGISSYYSFGWETDATIGDGRNTAIPLFDEASGEKNGGQSIDYSQTNVQVEGVDEPDVVKTDGNYLYIISNNEVIIVYAYPAEDAEILTRITFDQDIYLHNLFIHENRIIIFATSYNYPILTRNDDDIIEETESIEPWYTTPDTYVYIYDTTTIDTPVEEREIIIGGSYLTARMIGSYVYLITTQYTYSAIDEGTDIVPRLLVDSEVKEIPLKDIYYVDIPEKSSSFTNIISIDVTNPSSDVYAEVYLLGNGNIVYVSENNIYVTNPVSWYDYSQLENLLDDLVMPLLPDSLSTELDLVEQLSLDDYQKNTITQWILQNYAENLTTLQKEQLAEQVVEQLERTVIHRISIQNGDITYESQGSVPGSILNQFSLSEYEGHLRVSTTVNGWMIRSYLSDFEERNNIYVLNEDLDIIGSLTDLAEGETIFSTRFVNDLCYLVTFEQIDPFFVIDLATPTNPQVLGELKIPGFSTYLHPYDDAHIIGIGRDDQQVKITLFDVTNLNNPLELDTYAINKTSQEEWIWTQSSALYEHKAFLFSKAKNLLVIPIGTYQKESAYIFNISITNGIILNGIVTHDHQIEIEEPKEPWESSYYYGDWGNSIKRTLYIENSLYTISDNMIKINDLTTLSELNDILIV
jgi:uncharacterized secreted protein with C-terminal beta-propeller domain